MYFYCKVVKFRMMKWKQPSVISDSCSTKNNESPDKTRKHTARNICYEDMFSCFPAGFATRKTLFPSSKYMSIIMFLPWNKNHNFLLETIQSRETLGEYVSAAMMFLATCFLVSPGQKFCLDCYTLCFSKYTHLLAQALNKLERLSTSKQYAVFILEPIFTKK